jgi:hypothetical protein
MRGQPRNPARFARRLAQLDTIRAAAAAAVVAAVGASRAEAAPINGDWIGPGALWNGTANWIAGVVPGIGAGIDDVASFTSATNPTSQSCNVNVDVALGTINLDRPGGFTFTNPGSGSAHAITFLTTAGNAAINITASNGGGVYNVFAPLVLATDLDVVNAAGCMLNLSSTTISQASASQSITFYGGGTTTISFNHITGFTRVFGGTVSLRGTFGDDSVKGGLIVGDSNGTAPALVQLFSGYQIADGSSVVLNRTGTLDVGFFSMRSGHSKEMGPSSLPRKGRLSVASSSEEATPRRSRATSLEQARSTRRGSARSRLPEPSISRRSVPCLPRSNWTPVRLCLAKIAASAAPHCSSWIVPDWPRLPPTTPVR